MSDSAVAMKRVPICTPWAPSANAARKPRASPMPPAAMTGIFTASTTCGTSGSVATLPTWPPASVPDATTASTPSASMRRACSTVGITDTTLMPAALRRCTTASPGSARPVVTTGMPSAMQVAAQRSVMPGPSGMMLTPKGLAVRARTAAMSARSFWSVPPNVGNTPRPPASLTAATRSTPPPPCIAPCRIG